MSDFDKEAEREKLRKKFARDEEKRASTQRMSELLLKGATMTNKHCNQCSDPLFRYNGQTFCPSCQADADTTAEPDQQSTADTSQQPEPDHESTVDQPDHAQSVDSTETQSTQPTQSGQPTSPPGQQPQPNSSTASRQPTLDPQTEGLATARQSLERTITRFARRAEETEDPRRARELLTAAHEAASTLSELE